MSWYARTLFSDHSEKSTSLGEICGPAFRVSAAVPATEKSIPPKTHLVQGKASIQDVHLPLRFDPSLDFTRTANIGLFIQKWGVLPLTYLASFATDDYCYGFIGSKDFTMYPILPPGSFVQIDPARTRVKRAMWKSDYDRPIYFLETHDTYLCAWCAVVSSKEVQVQPHALSGLPARNYKRPSEIEVVGQVVGIATKLRSVNRNVEREPAMTRTHI